MSISRSLRFYELINARSNVNFMLEFECECLIKEHIIDAFKMVKSKHPYFQMQVNFKADGSAEFVNYPNLDDNINIEHIQLSSKSEFNDWESRLVKIGSNPEFLSSLVRLELYSFNNRQHQLLCCVNHAGKFSFFV